MQVCACVRLCGCLGRACVRAYVTSPTLSLRVPCTPLAVAEADALVAGVAVDEERNLIRSASGSTEGSEGASHVHRYLTHKQGQTSNAGADGEEDGGGPDHVVRIGHRRTTHEWGTFNADDERVLQLICAHAAAFIKQIN